MRIDGVMLNFFIVKKRLYNYTLIGSPDENCFGYPDTHWSSS